ncbi:MAG TPA: phage major capsid protein [Longimicrobiales bacterium]
MTIKELREKRARAVEQARAIMDKVEAEGRTMSDEETRSWDKWMDEADSLKATMDRMERLQEEERALETSRGRMTPDFRSTGDQNAELRNWLLGTSGSRDMVFNLASKSIRPGEDVRSWEQRAQGIGTPALGGYTVAPDFHRELEVALLGYGGARQAARIVRTSTGADLPWPTLNDTASEGRIIGENVAVGNSELTFGSVTFGAYKYTSDLILVSSELLQDSAVDLAEEIGGALGTRIGRVTNRHFTVGSGVAEPQGILTAASLGIEAATATAITYDELVDMEHSVNREYRHGAKWVFADSTLRELKKLRDDDGKLIWQPGMIGNAPDTILGYEYVVNDDMPAIGAGAKPILFGNISKFIIRDVREIVLRRLDERYAEQDAVAFVAFSRHDSRLVDAGTNPVKCLQMAAA